MFARLMRRANRRKNRTLMPRTLRSEQLEPRWLMTGQALLSELRVLASLDRTPTVSATNTSATKPVVGAAVPTFSVTGPTSGTFTAGQSVAIQWTAANIVSGSTISLCFDKDTTWFNGNETWIEVDQVRAASGNGSYTWNTSGVAPGTYYVAGYLYQDGVATFSHLTQAITIKAGAAPAPTFSVTGPTSGTYTAGQSVAIQWTAANIVSGSTISLCIDKDTTWFNGNETWIEVDQVQAVSGNGSYTWNTTGVAPGTYYLAGYLYQNGAATFSHLTQAITIKSADAPPVLAGIEGSTLACTATNPAVAITATLTASDTGSSTLAGATVWISGNYQNGQDVLAFTNTATIAGTWNAATGTLTLTGSDTLADYQAALRSVTYRDTIANASTATRTVSFEVNDGQVNSNVVARQVAVQAIVPPTFTVTGPTSGTFTVGQSVSLQWTAANVVSGSTVCLCYDKDTIWFNGNETWIEVDQVQGANGNGSYTWNTAGVLPGTYYLAGYLYQNGAATFSHLTQAITIKAPDVAPVLAGIESSALAYTEDNPATSVSATITASDVDNTSLAGATVWISGNYQSGQDLLSFTNTATITGTWNAATGTMTLAGNDTLANYQAALRNVTYRDTSLGASGVTRTVSFKVNDGQLNSNVMTRQIAVTLVDNPPVLAGIEGTALAYTTGSPAKAITASLTASDPDNTTLAGATVWISGNYQNGQDVLAFTNTATITGTWNASTGTLTLAGSDTLANYQAALRSVTYVDTSGSPSTATRTVSFRASDGQVNSNVATRQITVAGLPTGFQDPAIASQVASLDADGSISRNDMLQILDTVAAKGSLSSADFADLKLVLTDAAQFNIPGYVQVLAGDVINGNPANTNYQGQALGNLASGSSSTQLTELIGKWFLGADHPQSVYGYSNYVVAAGTLFPTTPSHLDEHQGILGDCYLIAALGSIADRNPAAIENMFINNGDGTYTIRLYTGSYGEYYAADGGISDGFATGAGTADYVTVDSTLPTSAGGTLVYDGDGESVSSSSNSLWLPLLEKAFVQWNETGREDRAAANTYDSIAAGWMAPVDAQALGYNAEDFYAGTTSTKASMLSALAAGEAVTIGTVGGNLPYGMVGSHAYAVIAYSASTDLFTLYNPWGTSQPQQLTWSEIELTCTQFTVVNAFGPSASPNASMGSSVEAVVGRAPAASVPACSRQDSVAVAPATSVADTTIDEAGATATPALGGEGAGTESSSAAVWTETLRVRSSFGSPSHSPSPAGVDAVLAQGFAWSQAVQAMPWNLG